MQLTCDTCGRIGTEDDGIEPGGPCQEPCDGTVRGVPQYKVGDRVEIDVTALSQSNSGTLATVTRVLGPDEADAEVGPMYEITLHVFESEIGEPE